jgi:hypothetical protein
MRRPIICIALAALTVTAFAPQAEAQAMRDYTVQFPAAAEPVLLAAMAKAYPQGQETTLADGSKATLSYGLTVCIPASAEDVAAGVCVTRNTTLTERRIILRRALRSFMRDHYLAARAGDAAEAARVAALAAATSDVPIETP